MYEWETFPLLQLNQTERLYILKCLKKLKCICLCEDVSQCGPYKQNFCYLCYNIVKDKCEIVINESERLSLQTIVLLMS